MLHEVGLDLPANAHMVCSAGLESEHARLLASSIASGRVGALRRFKGPGADRGRRGREGRTAGPIEHGTNCGNTD